MRPLTPGHWWVGCAIGLAACASVTGDGRRDRPATTEAGCPDTAPTWSEVAAVFDRWCTGCHAADRQGADRLGAPVGLDLDSWLAAVEHADAAATALADGTMPPLGGPEDAERRVVADWAACGAPGKPPEPLSCAAPVFHPGDLYLLHESDAAGFCDRANAVDGRVHVLGLGLDALDCLCEVTGDLVVSSPWVTDVDLPHLTHVGGNLSAIAQEALVRVDLPALTAVDGAVRFIASDVESIALPALADIGGALLVQDDAALGTLALPALTHVGGDALVTAVPALETLDLSALAEVEGTLELRGAAVPTVDLDALVDVRGDLRLQGLDRLSAVSWPSLARVDGSLEVITCDALQALRGPTSLSAVTGDLRIRSNFGLERVEGFDGVTSLNILSIAQNPNLRSITGFRDLTSVDVQITIAEDPVLEEIPAFAKLDHVGTRLELLRNDRLTRLAGFGALQTTTADLVVTDLPALVAMDAFRGLESAGYVELARLPVLVTAEGFDALGTAAGLVVFETGLADVDAFRGLTSVDADLAVLFNPGLVRLDGLHGVDAVGGDLDLGANPLVAGDPTWSLIDAIGADNVAGTIYVEGNAID